MRRAGLHKGSSSVLWWFQILASAATWILVPCRLLYPRTATTSSSCDTPSSSLCKLRQLCWRLLDPQPQCSGHPEQVLFDQLRAHNRKDKLQSGHTFETLSNEQKTIVKLYRTSSSFILVQRLIQKITSHEGASSPDAKIPLAFHSYITCCLHNEARVIQLGLGNKRRLQQRDSHPITLSQIGQSKEFGLVIQELIYQKNWDTVNMVDLLQRSLICMR